MVKDLYGQINCICKGSDFIKIITHIQSEWNLWPLEALKIIAIFFAIVDTSNKDIGIQYEGQYGNII